MSALASVLSVHKLLAYVLHPPVKLQIVLNFWPSRRLIPSIPVVTSTFAFRFVFVQAFLMRKLKISGSMALAMKLTPVLEAAAPKSKL